MSSHPQQRTLTPQRIGAEVLAQLAVAAMYFAVAEVGMFFMLPQANIALVWPATGLALALVYLMGYRYALGVALGTLAYNLYIDGGPSNALGLAAGIAGASLLGAWLLRRAPNFSSRLERVRDVLLFIALAVVAVSIVSSLFSAGFAVLEGKGAWGSFGSLWWVCWVAEMVGVLMLTPVLLTWCGKPFPRWSADRWLEAGALTALVALNAWVVYADQLPSGYAMARPLAYTVYPLMIWGALRFENRVVATLLLLNACIAVYYTAQGMGPFAMSSLREDMLSLDANLALLSFTVLVLTALMTERHKADLQLRESENKYRLIVENQTEVVVKTDRDGRIIFASPSTGDYFGQTAAALIGLDLIHWWRRQGVELSGDNAWASVLEPNRVIHVEHELDTAAGRRWIAWNARAAIDPDGGVSAVIAVGRDVTDRHRAEQEARQHLQELAHFGRISDMGQMSAGLAHELNQPLTAIMTFSQAAQRLLKSRLQDDDLDNALTRVVANAERAGNIIRQMRAFVRKDAPERSSADINRLVIEVLDLLGHSARQQRVALITNLGDHLPEVRVAEVQIHQVLVNLIRNAVEAIAEAGCTTREVLIRTRRVEAGVEVVVSDSGPGLPEDVMDELFEPFVSNKSAGMGLGLSISHSIIEAHDGRLSVGPSARGGAEFRFVLPSVNQETQAHVS